MARNLLKVRGTVECADFRFEKAKRARENRHDLILEEARGDAGVWLLPNERPLACFHELPSPPPNDAFIVSLRETLVKC